MPQLSIETFISQYFWLVVVLMMFHFIVSSTIIPNIILTLKAREVVEESSADDTELFSLTSLVNTTFSSDKGSWKNSCFYSKNNVDVLGCGLSFGEVSLLEK